jgi:hypothetical protein
MRRLGVRARGYKVAAGRAAELLGRLKPNGRVRDRSPLTDLVELDALLTGIAGKESLWRTLREVAGGPDAPGAEELDALIARAREQREALEAARPAVVRQALRRGAAA